MPSKRSQLDAERIMLGVMFWPTALSVTVAFPLFAGLFFGRSIPRGAALGFISEAAFLGLLALIGFLYVRSGEHSAPVTAVIVALTCGAMAGALGYCCKRLAIRLQSIPNRAWDSLILMALATFQVACMAAWLYAMWRDVHQDRLATFVADLIPPLGAVRGLLIWLGYV
jgi:hypothetical protein